MAQTTPADIQKAQQEADRRQREEQLRLQKDREDALKPAKPGSSINPSTLASPQPISPQGGKCRDIQVVNIQNAEHLSESQLNEFKQANQGKCLTAADVETLMANVTKAYIDKGYITTRVYLPAQDLTQGQLTLQVLEGKLEKVVVRDGRNAPPSSVNVKMIFPGLEGQTLNLRDIEQGLDQINRLSSNNATMAIEPGTHPGGSVVAIDNNPKFPISLYATLDNQGSTNTGKWQLGLTLSYDNLMTLDDFFTVTHRESKPNDVDRKYSGSDSFSYVIPYGYNTFTWGTSRSRYVSIVVLSSGQEARSNGDSNSTFIRADRVFYRNQSTRLTGSATLTNKSSANYFADQYLSVSSRTLQILDLDSSLRATLGTGVLGVDLGLAQGLKGGNALIDPDNLPDTQPRAQFQKIKVGLNFTQPFNVGTKAAAFTSQLAGQYALNTLYGSEQMSLGGIYSVRGHVRNALAADHGYYWRNEVSTQLPFTALGQYCNARPFIGFDFGQVWQFAHVPGSPEGTMTGAALGASINSGRYSWDILATMPLHRPSYMPKEGGATFFRLSVSI